MQLNFNNIKASVYNTYQDISFDIKDIKHQIYFNLHNFTIKSSERILFAAQNYEIASSFSKALKDTFINPTKWNEALNKTIFFKEQGNINFEKAQVLFNQIVSNYNNFENKFHTLYKKYEQYPKTSMEKQNLRACLQSIF